MKGRYKAEGGFTLVELLIVVGIIGVLVSVTMVSFSISVHASKKTACRGNLRIIKEQIINYFVVHNANPPTLDDLYPGFIEDDGALHCPESGEEYLYDPESGEVSCPYHTDI